MVWGTQTIKAWLHRVSISQSDFFFLGAQQLTDLGDYGTGKCSVNLLV